MRSAKFAIAAAALASLAALRLQHPRRLVFAAPVCSAEGTQAVAREADAVVCVATPERFFGVGAWYGDFTQTTDEEVVLLLNRSQESGFGGCQVVGARRKAFVSPWSLYPDTPRSLTPDS